MAAFALDGAGTVLVGLAFGAPIVRAEDALGLVKFSSIDTSAEVMAAIILPLWGAAWIYALFEPIVSAAPGKLILGLKIARPGGGKAPFAALLARYLVKNSALFVVLPFGFVDDAVATAAFLILGLTILGGALWGAGPERRTLHDRISGTAVFRRRDLMASGPGP